MKVTEQQARKLGCPLMLGKGERKTCCRGSSCMAWRWTDKLTEGPDSYRAEPGPTGYCGLAGTPECAGN